MQLCGFSPLVSNGLVQRTSLCDAVGGVWLQVLAHEWAVSNELRAA